MQCQEPRVDKAVRKMVEEQYKVERNKIINKLCPKPQSVILIISYLPTKCCWGLSTTPLC